MTKEAQTERKTQISTHIARYYNPNTKKLEIGMNLWDKDIRTFVDMVKERELDIEYLEMRSKPFTDKAIPILAELKIPRMDLTCNNIKGDGLNTLLKIPGIRWLKLDANTSLRNKDIENILSNDFLFPSTLLYLDFTTCHIDLTLLQRVAEKIRANNAAHLKEQLCHHLAIGEPAAIKTEAPHSLTKLQIYRRTFDEAIHKATEEIKATQRSLSHLDRVVLAREVIHKFTQLARGTLYIEDTLLKHEHKTAAVRSRTPIWSPDRNPAPYAIDVFREHLNKALVKAKELREKAELPPPNFKEKLYVATHILHKLIDLEPEAVNPEHETLRRQVEGTLVSTP
jgi:hypothetical protein